MPYVNTKEILEKANKEYYAVAALNINNLEFCKLYWKQELRKKISTYHRNK